MPVKLTKEGVIIAERIVDGVAINPLNGPMDLCEHHRRPSDEVMLWYKRPYIVTDEFGWQVMCLDMKRSDRASIYELTQNFDEAINLASQPIPIDRSRGNPYRWEQNPYGDQ